MRATALKNLALTGLLAVCAVASVARSQQCDAVWGVQTMQQQVQASIADSVILPNGDLVVIGDFVTIGGVAANRIARFDGTTWHALGSGLNQSPREIVLHPGGGFVVTGTFTQAGGVPANRIARWNQSVWTALGAGIATSVSNIAIGSNGDVYAITEFGGNILRRWNGTVWSTVPLGSFSGFLSDVTVLPNGNVVVAGFFSSIGGVTTRHCAQWNGTSWSAMNLTAFSEGLSSVVSDGSGNVYVSENGSDFTSAQIFRWNGSTWTGIFASPVPGTFILDLTVLPNGHVLRSEQTNVPFSSGSQPLFRNLRSVAVWDTISWTTLATDKHQSSTEAVNSLAVHPDGSVYACGNFAVLNRQPLERVAKWNGSTWQPLATRGVAPNNAVRAMSTLADGQIAVGGAFSGLGDVRGDFVATWNGQAWTRSTGLAFLDVPRSPQDTSVSVLAVNALHADASGNLFASGDSFDTVMRWNSTSWSRISSANRLVIYNPSRLVADPGFCYAIATLADGSIVAGGTFNPEGPWPTEIFNHIARFNGASWVSMGEGFVLNGSSSFAAVRALSTLPNGDLVAGGSFSRSGTTTTRNLARWNGTAWSEFGGGITGAADASVRAILQLPNGGLIVAGLFANAGGVAASNIARWNGTNWQPLGQGTDGQVNALALQQNGDIIAGGSFTTAGGIAVNGIARWNGSAWQSLGSGVGGQPQAAVDAIAIAPDGDIVAGGTFLTAGGSVSPYFATFEVAAGCICDTIDFNRNTLFPEDQDLVDFLVVLAGGACSNAPMCNDIDFNNDGLFPSDDDLIAFLRVLAGGACA